MNIIENIKSYFKKKSNNEPTGSAPEGVCPNCWGKQEWEGDFYALMKGNKLSPKDDTYNNFINKVVESNITGVKISADTYKCTSCKLNFSSES